MLCSSSHIIYFLFVFLWGQAISDTSIVIKPSRQPLPPNTSPICTGTYKPDPSQTGNMLCAEQPKDKNSPYPPTYSCFADACRIHLKSTGRDEHTKVTPKTMTFQSCYRVLPTGDRGENVAVVHVLEYDFSAFDPQRPLDTALLYVQGYYKLEDIAKNQGPYSFMCPSRFTTSSPINNLRFPTCRRCSK